MSEEELLIGEVARRAELRPSTIRYYESIGLLPAPLRVGGRRRYPPETVQTLAIIRAAQRAGLGLGDVRELLAASEKGAVSARLRGVAERKLPEVRALIERSTQVQRWLEQAADCRCPTLEDCALFDPTVAPMDQAGPRHPLTGSPRQVIEPGSRRDADGGDVSGESRGAA